MSGHKFVLFEHDILLFGRASDCHIQIPPQDVTASRHHFILEVNPPDAVIRDLGSRNGTWINGVKYGGREKGTAPKHGVEHIFPEVALRHGDKIQVGETIMAVSVELPAVCCQCNRAIPASRREFCAWVGGSFICMSCKESLIAHAKPPVTLEPCRCRKCGKVVTSEVAAGSCGAYICTSCRQKAVGRIVAHPHDPVLGGGNGASIVDEYEIEKKLGAGGFGAVYLARHKKTGRQAAIKVLLSKIAVDEDARQKFLREISSLEELRHQHIVTLLGHGSADGAFYFVMEFCSGGSVADLLHANGGKLPLSQVGRLALQALEGLAHAHQNGFVHRDLKPQNILLHGASGVWTAKIGDFGLAKSFEQAGFSGMTLTGQYCGTPHFMPREQVIQYRHVKPASDVWSVGATFYTMLSGCAPRDFPPGKDPIEIILRGETIPIRRRVPRIPKAVAEVIDRALLNSPNDRYQDAAAMLEALKKAL